ncbi:MAG: PHP domain-containing protein [Candidatus Omnitrophota bacterium]
MKEKRADLHIHTTYSDSSFTPERVVEYAKDKGLECIAIADHDSVNGLGQAMEAASSVGVEVIPAVEISAEEDGKEIHMLGYLIDYKDSKLLAVLQQIRDDRKKRLHKMVIALNQHGFNIDPEDIIRYSGDVSISRLHIAQYMKAKNLISSWREAFKKYIGDDKPCYVASFRLSTKQVIDLIEDAKGVPVIAHPGLNKVDKLLPKLIEEGIKGIEAYHSEHRGSVPEHYVEYARKHGLVYTGGSDCHGDSKGDVLMGNVTVPYSCVEELKRLSK